MLKKVALLFIILLFNSAVPAYTAEPIANTPILATYTDCLKDYSLTSDNLFYVILSAINEANYQIEEVQSKTGTIIFKAYSKDFIVIIAKRDSRSSFVKIVPCDNTYNFSTSLIQKIFSYIDINQKVLVQQVI